MILTVTLNPSVDYTVFVDGLDLGDTNRVKHTEIDAGGKGLNVSRILAQLGTPTVGLSLAGGAGGAYVREVLSGEEIPFEIIPIQGHTRSNFSIETGQGAPTTLNAKGPEISPIEWAQFLDRFRHWLSQAEWVVLAGSIPPGLPRNAYALLGQLTREAGKKLALDADGDAMTHGISIRPDLIKPNDEEAGRFLNRTVESEDEAIQAALDLKGHVAPDAYVLLSMGKRGALLAHHGHVWQGVAPEIESVSTVGAGDSMIGGFLSAIVRGDNPALALQWGLAAGAATATSDGTRLGQRSTIELLFSRASVRSCN